MGREFKNTTLRENVSPGAHANVQETRSVSRAFDLARGYANVIYANCNYTACTLSAVRGGRVSGHGVAPTLC